MVVFLSVLLALAPVGQASAPQAPLGVPDAKVLAREAKVARLIGLAIDGEHTHSEDLDFLDQAQKAAGERTSEIEKWRFFFLAMDKRWDDAFRQSERMRRMGIVTGGWLSDPQYAEIQKDPRWAKEVAAFERIQASRVDALNPVSLGLWTAKPSVELRPLLYTLQGPEIYRRLAGYDRYPKPRRTGCWYVDTLSFGTSASEATAHQIEFCVRIPDSYRPTKPTPIVMWVHGAWFRNSAPRSSLLTVLDLDAHDVPLHAEAAKRGYIEILPFGYSAVTSTVPGNARLFADILARVKRTLNVDDDRVFMSGHSNGASACFAAAAEDPTPFAAFYPINGWPLPALHYTNLHNRLVEGLTGERDELFPPPAVRELHAIAQKAGADWKLHLVPGGSHYGSEFSTSYAKPIFDQMAKLRRPALAAEKVWEADAGGPRRVDWLEILQVDPSRPPAAWQSPIVARNSKRTDAGETLTDTFVQNASSGTVRATYRDNTFTLLTSRVGKVRLWIHPEMVRLDGPVRVVANGKEVFRETVDYNPALMMNSFINAFDRRLVWANAIDVEIPNEGL